MSDIVLASASPRRRELLAALIDGFEVVAADLDEPLGAHPLEDAKALALAKAAHVAGRFPAAVIIAADTIVFDDQSSYGKPLDADDAIAMWQVLRGRAHRVVTAFAVIGARRQLAEASVSEVELANLDDSAIAAYVASRRPLDKAGAYAIQDEDVPTVRRLHGCYCSVMGLPLWRLKAGLEAVGVTCRDPDASFERCRTCPESPKRVDTS
jgi:MAF protein